LSALKESIDAIRQAEAKVDTDYIFINKVLTKRLIDINKLVDLDIKGNELDLMSSCFINDPSSKIERSLNKLEFFPVSQQKLNDLT
jgi:hypothetical protein